MRLTRQQQQDIRQLVRRHVGEQAIVSVYGSRTDDRKHGGDVDLLVETPDTVPLMQRAALKLALENSLSLPVDLLFIQVGARQTAFQRLAKGRAVPLGEHAP